MVGGSSNANPQPVPKRCCRCSLLIKIRPTAFLKIFQMLSVSITFGIFRGAHLTFGGLKKDDDPTNKVMTAADVFCSGIMVSELIITPMLFVGHHIQKLNVGNSYLEPLIHLVFCIFSLISGFIGLAFWKSPPGDWHSDKAAGIVMFVFCFITAFLYFLDILVFLRYKMKNPTIQIQSSA